MKTINNLHEFAIPKSVVWYFALVAHTRFSMKALRVSDMCLLRTKPQPPLESYSPWSPFIIDQGRLRPRNEMRDHSSYTPAVLKTCKELYNLKCQFTKKRNKIIITT